MKSFYNLSEFKALSSQEAELKLKVDGYNELPSSKSKSILSITIGVLKEPMFLLLITCSTLYMLIGNKGEGLMLMSSLAIVIFITFYQEKRTARALEALKELSSQEH